jgi:hypothetical protein
MAGYCVRSDVVGLPWVYVPWIALVLLAGEIQEIVSVLSGKSWTSALATHFDILFQKIINYHGEHRCGHPTLRAAEARPGVVGLRQEPHYSTAILTVVKRLEFA